jgi:hypothetical protein
MYVSLASVVVIATIALVAELSGQGQAPAAARKAAYRAPRTAWGQPDIHGDYTNKDEANTPLERPQQLAGKDPSTFTEADLAQLAKERAAQAQQIAGASAVRKRARVRRTGHDHLAAKGSRPWFIVRSAGRPAPAADAAGAAPPVRPRPLNNARNAARARGFDRRSQHTTGASRAACRAR